MRLRSLELENFRRHRRTRLEFQDGVTALVGPNGAGKSTLIEAIAFALYGPRAAGTGKDLIRSEGAPPGDNVRVALEMDLAGQAVRIVRELRGKAQSPLASLEVDGTVQVQPIAGSSEQATQLVERLVGLDRDGFLQTVVARQGELDRLGRLRPAERRAFILDLVGIGAVDAAIARAREQRRALALQAEEAARHVGDAAAIAHRMDEARQSHAGATAKAQALAATLALSEQRAAEALATLEGAREAAAERATLEGQAALAGERAAAQRTDAQRLRKDLDVAEAAVARLETLRPMASLADQVAIELANVQGLVTVRARRTAQESRIVQEETTVRRLVAEAEAVQVPPTPDLERLAAAADAAQAAISGLEQQRAVAADRLAQSRNDAAALASLSGDALCPACRQPVTGEHVASERAAARQRQAAAEAAAAAVAQAVQQAAQRLAAARAELADGQAEARRAEALSRRRETALQAAAGLQATVAALRETLPPDPGPAPDLDELRRQAEEARRARDEVARCEAMAAQIPVLRKAFTDAERILQEREAELADLRLRLATQPDAGVALLRARAAAEDARQAVVKARAIHLEAILAVQAALAAADLAEAEQARDKSARERVQALQAELAHWTAVVGAHGGGLLERFREHLVARTAPAINQEASHLLALFTQGRYTELVLDESYEVWMGDGGVLHPIERFSGGEQDLAHLALRLGISRLLATRADAPEIRFLALDEVFSSLDHDRCTALLGALQSLGGLYSQVLAVTHIERLQESFDGVLQVRLVDGETVVT